MRAAMAEFNDTPPELAAEDGALTRVGFGRSYA